MKIDMDKKDITRNMWAVCLIALGLILLGNYLALWNVTVFFKGWWTLFIILPSLISLFGNDSVEDKLTTGIVLVGGILFLAQAQHWLAPRVDIWMAILALVIVRIGIGMILKKRDFDANIKEDFDKTKMDRTVGVFAGGKNSYKNQEYNGGEATGVFGGAELNLKDAIINEDIYIDATAVFGGVDIIVPNDVNVKVNSTNIFGGTESHAKTEGGKHTIYVNSIAVFGGVEIK